jgi:G3E family GTPase
MPITRRVTTTPVPLTVIGGEPDSGKTTVLMNVLTQSPQRRVAAVIADPNRRVLERFGARWLSGDAAELPGGTLCCGFDGDFASALARISAMQLPATRVLLEAPTTSELRRALGYAYVPGFRPDGTIIVVNSEAVLQAANDEADGPPNLHEANVIVMNKADLISEAGAIRARRWLSRSAASARVVVTRKAQLAPPLVLGLDPSDEPDDVPVMYADWSPTLDLSTPVSRSRTQPVDLQFGERCRAWNVHCTEPVDAFDFKTWANHMPRTIIRGRGTVWLHSERHVPYSFDLIGGKWSLTRAGMWRTPPTTRLVLVGLQSQPSTHLQRELTLIA